MKKTFKIIWIIIQIIIIIYAILIVSYMSISNRYGFSETTNYVFNVDNDQLFLIQKAKKLKMNIILQNKREVYKTLKNIIINF